MKSRNWIVDEPNPRQSPHGEPKGCWDVTAVPAGFWGDLQKADELWQDCLAGQCSGDPFEKLWAVARLFGLERDPECIYRMANVAWANGAQLAVAGVPMATLMRLANDHYAASEALLRKVWQVQDVAGGGSCALIDQRRLLQRALGENPVPQHGTRLDIARTAAIAGWLAYHEQHLVTVRMVAGQGLSDSEVLLMTQLMREVQGWTPQASSEALARFIATTYEKSERLECLAIQHAVERSLTVARKRQWGPCEFLRDAVKRGQVFGRNQPDQASAVLQEVGEGVRGMIGIFESLLEQPLGDASNTAAWDALQDWMPRAHGADVSGGLREQGLLVLRHAYDFLFWFGLLREISRQPGGADRLKSQQPAQDIQASLPSWAADFVGREFDPAAARESGWFDQGSSEAHFGVEQGDGIWVFRIDYMGQGCCCGHVWWRFLFVKLDNQRRIIGIRAQVDEVFADGHGEFVTDEFLPLDAGLAIAALQRATRAVPASR